MEEKFAMDGSKPLVSVCLPVYNGANYLAQAIESVLAQWFSDFELLIADDCSTDETLTIIKEFAARDSRIKFWTNEHNLKLFGNYNACINRAEGLYIKPFAHDDLFHKNALKQMVAVLESHPNVSLVSCARGWIDGEGKRIEPASDQESKVLTPYPTDTQISGATAISESLKNVLNWLGEPCSQMFRKEHAGSGFDCRFQQIGDLEFSYSLLRHGDYYFIAEELCNFRKHAQSWSNARALELSARLDWFVLAARYKAFIPLTGMSAEDYLLYLLRETAVNFEYELSESGRFTRAGGTDLEIDGLDPKNPYTVQDGQIASVLNEIAMADIFSYFEQLADDDRDFAKELQGLGMIGFLQCVLFERKLRYDEKYRRRIEAFTGQLIEKSGEERTQNLELLKKTIEDKDREIAEMRTVLADMGNSASWKITAPLRMFREKFQ